MQYVSTRGGFGPVSAAEAIKRGIAPDGGLFVPNKPVTIPAEDIIAMTGMTYHQRAAYLLEHFLTDFSSDEIRECVDKAYSPNSFDTPEIAPVKKLNESTFILELWHGPTCAFKDMALQILPHLLRKATDKTGEQDGILILVATSGDTGKAALEGFKDVPGTKIIVFYPDQGVSEVQKRQMATQEGNNVAVFAVRGNFDDAQTGVKAIFTDPEINSRLQQYHYKFSSANSINWGRLVPQIVYYFSAYAGLLARGEIVFGDKINFVVPTGNFGNILAAYYARKMGLPVQRLICAANANNVLTDFIRTGTYDKNRPFHKTLSPSMDILVSSNLERLLYEITGHDTDRIRQWMEALKSKGRYEVDQAAKSEIQSIFWSDWAGDEDTLAMIKQTYQEYRYVLDTHTAVGKAVYNRYRRETGDTAKTVIASTASPFKFNLSVARALLGEQNIKGHSEFALLEKLSEYTGWPVPQGLKDLDKKPVRHNKVVAREEMAQAVLEAVRQTVNS